jgi:hypothetical protein
MQPGEFGLQVRLPHEFLFSCLQTPGFDCDAGVTQKNLTSLTFRGD